MFKGALYIINGERFHFFYKWSYFKQLAPALIKAQHSDKPSVVDMLRDIGAKMNRTYSDFDLYTLFVRKVVPSKNLLGLLGLEKTESMETEESNEVDPDYLELEKIVLDLISSKSLHWRHEQMAIGTLLLLLNCDCGPLPEVVELWLNLLVHDDHSVRLTAFQVRFSKNLKAKRHSKNLF